MIIKPAISRIPSDEIRIGLSNEKQSSPFWGVLLILFFVFLIGLAFYHYKKRNEPQNN